MKRASIIGLLLLPLLCVAPLLALVALTGGQQTVRVMTIPTPGGRGLLLITTPCDTMRSGSVGLWTARQRIQSLHVIPLASWPERRDFLGNGIVNRLLLRITTFRRC